MMGKQCLETELRVDTYRLAVLPIAYLGEQQQPFEQSRQDGALDESYRDVFHTGAWLYALYSYSELVRSHLGQRTAEAVWNCQQMLLSGGAREAREAIGSVFELISRVSAAGPSQAPDIPGSLSTTAELSIALSLLRNLPDSPDYSQRPKDGLKAGICHLQTDIHWRLASCLSRTRRDIVQTFFDTLAGAGPLLQ
jgi:hypothetical protein